MEAQQVVVMQTEACLEEEKIKNEEYLAVMRKYQERIDEMEVGIYSMEVHIETFDFVGSHEADGPKKRPARGEGPVLK